MDRIREGSNRLVIRPNNTLLPAFFLLLALTAGFTLILLAFNSLGYVFSKGPIAAALGWTVALISVIYKITAFTAVSRAVIWTIAGSEVIEPVNGRIKISARVFGIGPAVLVSREDVRTLTEIEHAQEKDVIYMIKSEMRIGGLSMEITTCKGAYKFGRCLTLEEAEQVTEAIKAMAGIG